MQRAPIRSIQLHGKLWFDETDNGYLQDKRERDFVRSGALGDTNYLPILQRSLWLPLVQGCGTWLYDFGPRRNTGWWDSQMYLDEISRSIRYFSSLYGRAAKSGTQVAEALVVWDTESFYAVKNVNSKACEKGLDLAAEQLLHSGVAMDQIYAFDLPRIDLNSYKAILFMNAWTLNPAQRQFIRDTVAQKSRTLIWNYGAGYSDGIRKSKTLTEQLTGISLQQEKTEGTQVWIMEQDTIDNAALIDPLWRISDPEAKPLATFQKNAGVAIAQKDFSDYSMVYSAVPLHGAKVFRGLLQQAGCQVMNAAPDVVYASDDLILLHTGIGGHKALKLKNGKVLELELPKTATRLFDSGTGLEVLIGY
jgi:hypothetical protein